LSFGHLNDSKFLMKSTSLLNKSSIGARLLIIAGTIVGIIALAHVAVIFGGASWYRAFGAGENMAQMAENGSPIPALAKAFIAIILGLWAFYAYAGAIGLRVPFLRSGLLAVSTIFILRGFSGILFYWQIASLDRGISQGEVIFIVGTSTGSFVLGVMYLSGYYFQRHFLRGLLKG
jgi:hypothetical protein